MLRTLIRNNTTLVAILLFLVIFIMFQISRPGFLYNIDGSIKEFGVGYQNKTILPIWLLSIILGILCYLFVLYYLTYPKWM
jgi:uncharacterized membrane protein YozB (DUF420 family)